VRAISDFYLFINRITWIHQLWLFLLYGNVRKSFRNSEFFMTRMNHAWKSLAGLDSRIGVIHFIRSLNVRARRETRRHGKYRWGE